MMMINKDEILTTPLRSAQDDIFNNESGLDSSTSLGMTILYGQDDIWMRFLDVARNDSMAKDDILLVDITVFLVSIALLWQGKN